MRSPSLSTILSAGVLVLAGLAAYHNSLGGPFIFDDVPAIAENPTIHHLWPIGDVLWPSSAKISGATGRPLVNLSFAVNYALGGLNVRGYHELNLTIHLCAALVLFGVVRRTWAIWRGKAESDGEAMMIALTVALIWTVHPLQTDSVTYIMSRTESLVGLFYLVTVYCFIRASESRADPLGPPVGPGGPSGSALPSEGWALLSVAACFLGSCAKEVMVTAPLIVLLYDRTFLAGGFWEALRRRRWLYLGLAASWLRLGYLVVSEHGARGTSAGFGVGISSWSYGLAQCWAVVHYLALSFWPRPLVLDYGSEPVKRALDVAPQALLLLLLGAGTIWALARPRWRAIGFAGAWFFLILAPSSSIYPLPTELIAEHRMYLPLAAVVTVAVAGLYVLAGRRSLVPWLVVAGALVWLTAQRNLDYRSVESIWGDTVAKRPDNHRALTEFGRALADEGRLDAAMVEYRKALAAEPGAFKAENDLAIALAHTGHAAEALRHFQRASELQPDSAEILANLGLALVDGGRAAEAEAGLRRAFALRPDLPEARLGLARVYNNLAVTLAGTGHLQEAAAKLQAALELEPDYTVARENLAKMRLALGSKEGETPAVNAGEAAH